MLPRSNSKATPAPSAPLDAKRLRMLVVNDSTQLPLAFADESDLGLAVTRKRLTQVPPGDGDRYGMIVAETPAEWNKDGARLRRLIEAKPKTYVIIAPAPLLQQTAAEIGAVGRALVSPAARARTAPHPPTTLHPESPDGEFLDGFVQKKLRAFVHAFSASGGRNLYGFLMKEVDRPLIAFALEATGGNQTRAAELLGVNRNTLAKRMRACQMGVKEKKSRGRARSR
jgi:DNA-binding protein Fis